jgi:uncharacterized protein (DUF58 family)
MFFKEKFSNYSTSSVFGKTTFIRPNVEPEQRVKITLKTLIDLAPQALAVNLKAGSIRSMQSGGYVSRLKGRGMEFDEVRLYQPGDDVRSIDWKVTARTDKPHTKVFREERERPVFISVDNRKTMQFATRGVFKSVQAAKLAALVAWAAQHHGDRIGGQFFSNQQCYELKPQHGKHGVLRFLNGLVNPPNVPAVEMPFEQILARLNQHAKPGSLIYLISDFRGLNPQAETVLAKLARHCEVVLIFIFDPLEKSLPENGRYRFTDSQREVVIDTSDKMRLKAYQGRFLTLSNTLTALAKKNRLKLIFCETTQDPLACLR